MPTSNKTKKNTNKKYYASIYPGPDKPIPTDFVKLIKKLEKILNVEIWLLIQNGDDKDDSWEKSISGELCRSFRDHKKDMDNKNIALLIDSPGGCAHCSYKISRLFQTHSKSFMTIIPQYAKSAATLLSLGAKEILMSIDAEFGPLDVQILDIQREEVGSALDAVQSLERLNAFSLTAIDQIMQLLLIRTNKKIDTLLPYVLEYTTNFVRPLLEKIDTIDFTKKSRDLKEAEEYAIRLLKPNYHSEDEAKRIARHLVEKYPTHRFPIDKNEAKTIFKSNCVKSIIISDTTSEIENIFCDLFKFIDELTIIGSIKEV